MLYQSSPSRVAEHSMHMMWQVGDKQGPYLGQNSDQSSSSSELEPVEVGWEAEITTSLLSPDSPLRDKLACSQQKKMVNFGLEKGTLWFGEG